MTEPTKWAEEIVERGSVERMQADADHIGVSLEVIVLMGLLTEFQRFTRKPKEPWQDGSV